MENGVKSMVRIIYNFYLNRKLREFLIIIFETK